MEIKIKHDEQEELTDNELHEMYNDMLDEIYPDCKIAGYTYATSRALKEVDPTAYRCGFNDWLDAMCDDNSIFCKDDKYYREQR